jgi:hypothetical protein
MGRGLVMRVKFATLVGGLIGAAAIAIAVPVTSLSAQASTLTPASSTISLTAVRPLTTAGISIKVRCGKFVGKINHGGTGGILNRAYLQVEGTLTSSCNSTTFLQIRYDTGLETFPGTTIAKTGRGNKEIDWEVHSIEGTYGHIGIRVGTNDGQKDGKILWSAWKNV